MLRYLQWSLPEGASWTCVSIGGRSRVFGVKQVVGEAIIGVSSVLTNFWFRHL